MAKKVKKAAKNVAKKTAKAKKSAAPKGAKKATAKKAKKPAAKTRKAKAPKAAKKVAAKGVKTAAKKPAAAKVAAPKNSAAKATTLVLTTGDSAPDIRLTTDGGSEFRLADFRGRKNVLVYFYPKDDTPGCTVEACAFRDDFSQFGELETEVVGISPDDQESHEKFKNKYGLPFTLLADVGSHVAKDYGVWVEKNMYGKRYMGIQRATFLVDRSGKIAAVWPKVNVDGHSQEDLSAIRSANQH